MKENEKELLAKEIRETAAKWNTLVNRAGRNNIKVNIDISEIKAGYIVKNITVTEMKSY